MLYNELTAAMGEMLRTQDAERAAHAAEVQRLSDEIERLKCRPERGFWFSYGMLLGWIVAGLVICLWLVLHYR